MVKLNTRGVVFRAVWNTNNGVFCENSYWLIRVLHPNRARSHNGISTRMLKFVSNQCSLYDSSNFKLFFQWERNHSGFVNIDLCITKVANNLFAITALYPKYHYDKNIFEEQTFNCIFDFVEKRNLLSKKQSRDKTIDSCLCQLVIKAYSIFLAKLHWKFEMYSWVLRCILGNFEMYSCKLYWKFEMDSCVDFNTRLFNTLIL